MCKEILTASKNYLSYTQKINPTHQETKIFLILLSHILNKKGNES
jgi:hypothetical protein